MFIDGEFKTIKSDIEKCTNKKEYLIFLAKRIFLNCTEKLRRHFWMNICAFIISYSVSTEF